MTAAIDGSVRTDWAGITRPTSSACYQYAGQSDSGLQATGSPANWRRIAVEKLSRVELLEDAGHTAPNHSRPQTCVATGIRKISGFPGCRRKDSEATARAVGGREQSVRWRWTMDYASRGERGDPRGRKSGGGSGADSPTWPARAEGEKRFRSATRNPYEAIHKVA